MFSPQVLASTSPKLAACVHPTERHPGHILEPRGVGIAEQGHSRLSMGRGVCVTTPSQVSKIEGVTVSDTLVLSLPFPRALIKGRHSSPILASLTY